MSEIYKIVNNYNVKNETLYFNYIYINIFEKMRAIFRIIEEFLEIFKNPCWNICYGINSFSGKLMYTYYVNNTFKIEKLIK